MVNKIIKRFRIIAGMMLIFAGGGIANNLQ